MSKAAERQKFIRHWMETTGESEIDMHSVARMAMDMGWKAPPPITEVDRLARQFKDAARQEIRHDRKTGRPYKGFHAVPKQTVDGQMTFSYIDIDDPKAKPESFQKACYMRREQSLGDVMQLRLDQLHWNATRTEDQKIPLFPADMEFDIELRLTAMDDRDEAA